MFLAEKGLDYKYLKKLSIITKILFHDRQNFMFKYAKLEDTGEGNYSKFTFGKSPSIEQKHSSLVRHRERSIHAFLTLK